MDAEVTLSTSQTSSLQEDYIAILDKGLPSFYQENSRKDEYFKKENSQFGANLKHNKHYARHQTKLN